MGSLLVVTGPPGAGKSTVARILVDRAERSVLVKGDAFFGFLASGAQLGRCTPSSPTPRSTVGTFSTIRASAP
jgi:dephospho-CoA kinase